MDSTPQRNVRAIPHADRWDVGHEGAKGERVHFLTEEEAVDAASVIARRAKVELLVPRQDGQKCKRSRSCCTAPAASRLMLHASRVGAHCAVALNGNIARRTAPDRRWMLVHNVRTT
ncbi:DUF2188 domain-containing protein [Cupriavidus sp. CuC1]|uniref:DUF2188 domain-containing protein n=1 Tax=Cupriavidus sp. CuC1 TaxID=3373131 RepID=UPI0037CCC4B5